MAEYNEAIYRFIKHQLSGVKYAYARDITVEMFKKTCEGHYGFSEMPLVEYEHALEWAIADVFGGGCEVETY